jgi:SOS-response transcriptional repressor LexA
MINNYQIAIRLKAILDYQERKWTPSFQEIANIWGLTDGDGARTYCLMLQKMGYVDWKKHKTRTIVVTDEGLEFIKTYEGDL